MSDLVCSKEQQLNTLLQKLRKMPISFQRAVCGIVGACCADAATRPTHWLYDQMKLESIIGNNDPSFWPENISPYYSIPTGRNSCYFDLGYVMLSAITQSQLSNTDSLRSYYMEKLLEFFGPGSEYSDAFQRRLEKYDPAKRYAAREPILGPWQQESVTVFLETYRDMSTSESGDSTRPSAIPGNPESQETDGLVCTLPYILLQSARMPDLWRDRQTASAFQGKVRDLASVLSTNRLALRHTLAAALILNAIVNTGNIAISDIESMTAMIDEDIVGCRGVDDSDDMQNEIPDIITEIDHIQSLPNQSIKRYVTCVTRWGKACANPGSFMGAMLAVLTSSTFEDGIKKIIMAGGCNCSRANLAGACLGAAWGIQTIPTPNIYTDRVDSGQDTSSTGVVGDETREHVEESNVNYIGEGNGKGIPYSWLLRSDKAVEVLTMAIAQYTDVEI